MTAAPADPGPLAAVRRAERDWQNVTGWAYQERVWARPGTRLVLERQFERIRDSLALAPGSRVLDLGCGTGRLVAWLMEFAPARLHGVDLSLAALQAARAACAGAGLAAADAERLPFRAAAFDAVVCNGSAHHFLDLAAALREAHRVLAPGGRLVMYEPSSTWLADAVRGTLLRNSRLESPADRVRKHEFSRRSVERTLAEAGFAEISSRCHDFLAYPLTGMYLEPPWSRWRALFAGLAALERWFERRTALRPLLDRLSWRLRVVAHKPSRALTPAPRRP